MFFACYMYIISDRSLGTKCLLIFYSFKLEEFKICDYKPNSLSKSTRTLTVVSSKEIIHSGISENWSFKHPNFWRFEYLRAVYLCYIMQNVNSLLYGTVLLPNIELHNSQVKLNWKNSTHTILLTRDSNAVKLKPLEN